MGFLGGFLKFISVLSLIASTVFCTAVAVMNNMTEVYITMGVIWVVCLLTCLTIWGFGCALSEVKKLKKRVETLERKLQRPAEGTFAPEQPLSEQPIPDLPNYVGHYDVGRPKSGAGKWVLIVVLVLAIAAVLGAIVWVVSGRLLAPEPVPAETSPVIYFPEETAPVLEAPAIETPAEEAPAAGIQEELPLGGTIATDFVSICLDECIVDPDIKMSVTMGNVTRTTGPDPLPGQSYICLEGTIQNTSTSPLPVYDFFTGKFELDGYTYKVGASDCDILTPDGQPVSNIDPLMEYTIRIYTAIPNQLADSISSAEFTIGFFDGFENQELASVRAFSEDPIAECPYQFAIKLF